MLSCEKLSVFNADATSRILSEVDAEFSSGKMSALIGSSGSGKTTLMKALLGIYESTGRRFLDTREIFSSEDLVDIVAFTPQFSIAHPLLSVEETIFYALRLKFSDRSLRKERLEKTLSLVGLTEHRDKRVSALSGGQLRRLGLGIELTMDPRFLFCDEVTSGLDPRTEDQILDLLHSLTRTENKGVVCVIHNLAKLHVFDDVTVVHEGQFIFQGSYDSLLTYFPLDNPVLLYDCLAKESPDFWVEKWKHHRNAHEFPTRENAIKDEDRISPMPLLARKIGTFSQFLTLLQRRSLLFFRDRGCWVLTLAMALAFPCIVVIFALDGLPQIVGLSLEQSQNFAELMQDNLRYRIDAGKTASLVTGIILFQVILLTLMGSNNGAREIASERLLYEKERLDGLKPTAYVFSKLIFVSLIALLQGAWMTIFVKIICGFPGPWSLHLAALSLSCVSMSLVCLAFSAILNSSEKASILSIYLVGFQLPLSGIVLALPNYFTWIFRPFINAYWSWGAYFSAMKDSRFYDAFRLNDHSWLPSVVLCFCILALHTVIAILFVFWGCNKKRRW